MCILLAYILVGAFLTFRKIAAYANVGAISSLAYYLITLSKKPSFHFYRGNYSKFWSTDRYSRTNSFGIIFGSSKVILGKITWIIEMNLLKHLGNELEYLHI